MTETQDRLEERLTRLGCDKFAAPKTCDDVDAATRSWERCIPCEARRLLAALRQSQDIEAAAREVIAIYDMPLPPWSHDDEQAAIDRLRAALAPKAEEAPR